MLTAHKSGLPRLFEVDYSKQALPFIKAFFTNTLGDALVVKRCKNHARLLEDLGTVGIMPYVMKNNTYQQTVMLVGRHSKSHLSNFDWKGSDVARKLEYAVKKEDIGNKTLVINSFAPLNYYIQKGMSMEQFEKEFSPSSFDKLLVQSNTRFATCLEENFVKSGFQPTYRFTCNRVPRPTQYLVYMKGYANAK